MVSSSDKVIIGFSKPSRWKILAEIIKFVDKSEFSHVYIRRKSKYGEYVYHAAGTQVNFMGIDAFLAKNTVVEEYEFEINDSQTIELISFCIKNAGKPYGIKQLFRILLSKLGIKTQGDGELTQVCSELAFIICQRILKLEFAGDEDTITPKQLNELVKLVGRKL